MKHLCVIGVMLNAVIILAVGIVGQSMGQAARGVAAERFSPYVDEDGAISLPKDFRANWAFIGNWSISGERPEDGAIEFHNVYTQPSTIYAYRRTGRFPDGAVLVKEVIKTKTGQMTRRTASWADEPYVWFVMVKDVKGRFKGSGNWGDGWGWALFRYPDRETQMVNTYKSECLGCHIPARKDDWVYVRGYPVLRSTD